MQKNLTRKQKKNMEILRSLPFSYLYKNGHQWLGGVQSIATENHFNKNKTIYWKGKQETARTESPLPLSLPPTDDS